MAGMNQTELARLVGKREASVSDWLTKGAMPKGDVLLLLPAVLRVSGHWLLTGEGEPYPMDPEVAEQALADIDRRIQAAREATRLRREAASKAAAGAQRESLGREARDSTGDEPDPDAGNPARRKKPRPPKPGGGSGGSRQTGT